MQFKMTLKVIRMWLKEENKHGNNIFNNGHPDLVYLAECISDNLGT